MTNEQIQAKATALHLTFNAMEIHTPMEDMAAAKQEFFEDFLRSFAKQIESETREEDAKICDMFDEAATTINMSVNCAKEIRSKIIQP